MCDVKATKSHSHGSASAAVFSRSRGRSTTWPGDAFIPDCREEFKATLVRSDAGGLPRPCRIGRGWIAREGRSGSLVSGVNAP